MCVIGVTVVFLCTNYSTIVTVVAILIFYFDIINNFK